MKPSTTVRAEQPAMTPKPVKAKPLADKIIRLYFGEPRLSLSEVAKQTGVSRGTVDNRIKQAGRKLRSVSEATRLGKLGRSRPNFSHSTHPDEGPADNWKIVELKIAGKLNNEIAKQLNRSTSPIYLTLCRMGFPAGARVTPCYSFGEVFDQPALRRLHEISGLNVTEFAKQLGVTYSTAWSRSRWKEVRQLHFSTARKASQWRNSLFRRLMSNASRNPGRQTTKYAPSRVIVTFFPNLRQRYSHLLEVLHRLGKTLRDNPEWSQDELQQYLCEEARKEQARRAPGDLFVRFLPWAPELMPFLARKLEDIRGIHHQQLAWQLIAGALGTTKSVISRAIDPVQALNIKPIPPEQMRWLILGHDAERGQSEREVQTETKKRGPKKKKTQQYIDAEKLNLAGHNWPQVADIVLPGNKDRKAAGESLRQGVFRLRKSRKSLLLLKKNGPQAVLTPRT